MLVQYYWVGTWVLLCYVYYLNNGTLFYTVFTSFINIKKTQRKVFKNVVAIFIIKFCTLNINTICIYIFCKIMLLFT